MHHKLLYAMLLSAFRPMMALPSAFSVEAFGQGSFEGKGDTRRLQIEAKEYTAMIEGPWGQEGKTRLRTTDKGQLILDVVWRPDDPEQKQRLGIDNMPTVRQSVFLDVTPAGGLDLAPFKNGTLNRLREALGMNVDGQKWGFADFVGKVAKVKLEHKSNKDDPENPYQNVTAVTKM